MRINRCPKCESARIGFDTFSAVWRCKNCGYSGPLVISEKTEKKEIKDDNNFLNQ